MSQAVIDHFEEQAGFCEAMGSPFTARLLTAMARDLAAGGPTAALVAGWPGSPRADAVSLRLAGALHAAALSGRDPELAAAYPAARATPDGDAAWEAARAFLARDSEWVSDFLRHPPQTNEVNRSIALFAAFLHVARRFPDLPFDMLEIGASAGLNLHWDRFAYRTESWTWGRQSAAPIETRWSGPPPALDARPIVRSRAACDRNPLDVRDPDDRLRLRAYIWPDQRDRLARLDAAIAIAVANDVRVERADAAEWLEDRLARRAQDGVAIVYHSVFYQYPSRETRHRIRAAIERAGASSSAPLAWVRLEPEAILGGPRDSIGFLVDVVTWPGGERRTLARTDGHVRAIEATG